jgi:hypothetical protein
MIFSVSRLHYGTGKYAQGDGTGTIFQLHVLLPWYNNKYNNNNNKKNNNINKNNQPYIIADAIM